MTAQQYTFSDNPKIEELQQAIRLKDTQNRQVSSQLNNYQEILGREVRIYLECRQALSLINQLSRQEDPLTHGRLASLLNAMTMMQRPRWENIPSEHYERELYHRKTRARIVARRARQCVNNLRNCQSSIDSGDPEMASLRQKLAIQLASPKNNVTVDLPQLHERLMSNPHVFRVQTNASDGKVDLYVWLEGLTMTSSSEDETSISLAPLILHLRYTDGKRTPCIQELIGSRMFIGYDDCLVHPHWLDNDSPCLGDFATVIAQMHDTGSIDGAVWAYMEFLRWYAPEDSAGEYGSRWDYAPEDSYTRAALEKMTQWNACDSDPACIRSEDPEGLRRANEALTN